MAKPCTICSATQEIQGKVLEWHQSGKSYRDIEGLLKNEGKINISNSSIRRHLVNCVGEKEQSLQEDQEIMLQNIDQAPLDNTTIHRELCNVLTNAIRIFNKTIGEMAETKGNSQIQLEAVKTLDVLINGFEKLYQNPKEGNTQKQQRIVLSDLQVKIMKEVAELPESAPDKDIKAKVADVFKSHEALAKSAKDDKS